MKIASNKLSDLYQFWKSELVSIYDEEELYAIFELTCEHFLGYTKTETKQNIQNNINQSDVLKIYDTAKALKKGQPIQYILGVAYFYDLSFKVTPATLIPRPETEELVHNIINQFKKAKPLSMSILDIGTGSGCIPITLKKHLPQSKVSAIDVSEDALTIAKYNAQKNEVEVEFIKEDILDLSSLNDNISSFNLIISNPPYVLKSEAGQMAERVLNYEPHLALFVEDNDPIIFYKSIINFCGKHLYPNGYVYFELNPMYALAVKDYAIKVGLFQTAEIVKDMSNKERFFIAQKHEN